MSRRVYGFENIDLSLNTNAQTLLLTDKDVLQLSDNIAGSAGDVIMDFGFGKNGAQNADTIKLDDLFASSVISQLGGGSVADATALDTYLKFEWTHDNSNLQLVCSADLAGTSHYSKLFTLTNLQGTVGTAVYDTNQPHLTRLSGDEPTSNAILQKLLEEGRMVIQ